MTEREQAINRDLRILDEAHRLGRITRAEYRLRRRRVLESLRSRSSAVTARQAPVLPDASTSPGTRPARGGTDSEALTSLLSMRPPLAPRPLLAIVTGLVLLLALAGWLVFRG